MKRRLFILVILLIGSLSAAFAQGYDFSKKYYFPESDSMTIYYNIISTSPAEVEVTNYYGGDQFAQDYPDYDGTIHIPSTVEYGNVTYTVTEIGRYAFGNCEDRYIYGQHYDGLDSVTLPNTIRVIREQAFADCGITNLTIPNSVTEIEMCAFYGSNLKSITLSTGITAIRQQLFCFCDSLESIVIPNGVTSIELGAFMDCHKLKSVSIPNTVQVIDYGAFQFCYSLESIIMPDSLRKIGQEAFFECGSLRSVTFPTNSVLDTIEPWAFCNTTSLYYLKVPNSVRYIGEKAFGAHDYYGYLFIPRGVRFLEFHGPAGHSYDTWGAYYRNMYIEAPFAYADSTKRKLLGTIDVMTDSIIIPNTVTRIDNEAFIVCFRLEFVDFEMPSSLSSIPDGAFRRCNHLRTVRMPNSIDTIGGYAFFECDSLRGMDLPDSLKYVGTYAFYNTYNDTLIVPRGIRNVGSYPFTHIEKLLFESGDNNYNNILEDIHTCGFRYSGSYYACNRHQTVLGEYNFGQVEGYFTYLDTAKTILYKYDDEDIATSVTVPNYVIELSKNSFSNNVDLETIILHDGITKIGTGAFRYCYSLDSIILPSTLTKINDYMFSYDSSLVRLDIPDSVRSIGVEVFAGCVSLSQVNIPDAVTSIGNYAFYDCIALDSLHLGGHLQSIGNWAYTGCTNLTAITSENTTPPAISWNTFSNVPKTIPLYVPYESMSLYQSAQGWYEFTNILPIGGYPEPEGPKYDTISASICQGGDYCANGFNILNVMQDSCYERIIYTDNEIDSVITLILKVLPVYSNTVSAELCAGDDYSSHGFYFENLQESDTHTLSLQSFYGCDSSVVLYLTVNASYNPTIMADVCRGNDYVANGFNIMDVQSDSIYTQYLLSNKGCDSITLLSLLVHDTSSIMLNATICQGSDYTSDGFAIYDVQQGGSYSINYTNAQGCDSIVTLNLTMNPAYASSFHASVCQGDDYTMNGFNVTDVQTGGDYDLTMQSIRTGCDSVVTVHLSVNPTYNIPIVATTCQGSDYVENGFSLMDVQENDTLTHMLQSIQCCDSITTLFLTVTPTYDTVIEVEVEPGGSYNENGLNLDNIQEDATITDVYPTIFGCDSIVTIHIKVKDVGIREAEGTDAFEATLYPNPADEIVTLRVNELESDATVEIYDALGRLTHREMLNAGQSEFLLSVVVLSTGTYSVRVCYEKGCVVRRLVVK